MKEEFGFDGVNVLSAREQFQVLRRAPMTAPDSNLSGRSASGQRGCRTGKIHPGWQICFLCPWSFNRSWY